MLLVEGMSELIFVVEQNRDAQLRAMIAIETGIARDRMTSILDYNGLPLTAGRVVDAIVGPAVAAPASSRGRKAEGSAVTAP